MLFGCSAFRQNQSDDAGLTLPDTPSVDVDLDGVGGVERLVIMDDEDVAAQGVNPAGVHHGILGKHISCDVITV